MDILVFVTLDTHWVYVVTSVIEVGEKKSNQILIGMLMCMVSHAFQFTPAALEAHKITQSHFLFS